LANPYRGSTVLWRIHAASLLLVVPQSVVWTFTLVWLMADLGWQAAPAGVVVTVAQLLGAAGRVAAGHWSDRMNARLRPIRIIAVVAASAMLLLGLAADLDSPLSVVIIVAASAITVTDNGLAFTAIAEIAGPYWSGRALGVQYTSQMVTMGGAPPLFGALIAIAGFPVAFAATAIFALAAVPIIPVDADDPELLRPS
jgi:MFS family permease